jgi:hypothetical protein
MDFLHDKVKSIGHTGLAGQVTRNPDKKKKGIVKAFSYDDATLPVRSEGSS